MRTYRGKILKKIEKEEQEIFIIGSVVFVLITLGLALLSIFK